jgi:hypothetical protein
MSLASYYAHCYRFDAPEIYTTAGMNGTVCAVTAHPSTLDVSCCCDDLERVNGNCLQFCEKSDGDGFKDCVNSGANTTTGFYKTTCRNASAVEPVGNATESGGTGEKSGAGESSSFFSLDCLVAWIDVGY